jgi:hypothetical protein
MVLFGAVCYCLLVATTLTRRPQISPNNNNNKHAYAHYFTDTLLRKTNDEERLLSVNYFD